MTLTLVPGTVLPYDPDTGNERFLAETSLWSFTGGMSLSQLTTLTGLEASTIQNWVKRGWVSRTVGKKYSRPQVARILLINLLRECLPLDRIALLLSGVNGKVGDLSDDIIDEGELYDRLCRLLIQTANWRGDREDLQGTIDQQLADYQGPTPDAKKQLAAALEIMVLAYQSNRLKRLAEERLTAWLRPDPSV